MTQDEIIEMAKQAGWKDMKDYDSEMNESFFIGKFTDLKDFANLVAQHERENTNNAYKERNQLVALLSTLFPSGKAKTAIDGWDESWHGCVYIEFPWGQASWHYHTDDEWMFEHLPQYTMQWDGHTTDAKYRAIAKAIRAKGQA